MSWKSWNVLENEKNWKCPEIVLKSMSFSAVLKNVLEKYTRYGQLSWNVLEFFIFSSWHFGRSEESKKFTLRLKKTFIWVKKTTQVFANSFQSVNSLFKVWFFYFILSLSLLGQDKAIGVSSCYWYAVIQYNLLPAFCCKANICRYLMQTSS